MSEIERIVDQIERAYDGDPWYGNSLCATLADLDADAAALRVVPGAHTAWEIVLHIAAWMREVTSRLGGRAPRDPDGGDWPTPPPPSADAWRRTLDDLEAAHRALVGAVRDLPGERLHARVGDEREPPLGSGVTVYVMLHGLVQHTVAHTAQISLLRRGMR